MKTNDELQTIMYRGYAASLCAAHIEALCSARGWALVQGTPATTGEKIVRSWPGGWCRAFAQLANVTDEMIAKSALARSCKMSSESLDKFWSGLRRYTILVRTAANPEPTEELLFRRGKERFFSSGGIRLRLNLTLMPFAQLQHIFSSTVDVHKAYSENAKGAADLMAQDDSRSESERLAATNELLGRTNMRVSGPQLNLLTGTDNAE